MELATTPPALLRILSGVTSYPSFPVNWLSKLAPNSPLPASLLPIAVKSAACAVSLLNPSAALMPFIISPVRIPPAPPAASVNALLLKVALTCCSAPIAIVDMLSSTQLTELASETLLGIGSTIPAPSFFLYGLFLESPCPRWVSLSFLPKLFAIDAPYGGWYA